MSYLTSSAIVFFIVFVVIVCFTSMEDKEKEMADSIGVKSFSWDDFLDMV